MKKEEYIQQLLDKYLDGDTSIAEEEALRGYFIHGGDDIPEEWRPYKALFTYIVEERADKTVTKRTVTKRTVTKRTVTSSHVNFKALLRYRRVYAAMTAAAALIAVMMISLPHTEKNYAVIDGKVYTDKKIVEDEALKALDMVSSDQDADFSALEMMRQ